ncbi:transcriptional repressor [Desulforhopalus vacuolatus]|nr:transcriptional repressor [Desulforhopalus vacuolatus]
MENFRITPQRQVILEELSKVNSHPAANEVFDMVRTRLPRIGLGTVYRNLEIMADNGIILKIDVGGTQKRFDAIVEPHYHIRCTECGRVDDMDVPVQKEFETMAAASTDYKVQGHRVEFFGICPDCQKAKHDT